MASLSLRARCSVAATTTRNAFSSQRPQLSLITDFGSGDEAVYAIKSAARHIQPKMGIEDIYHNIPLRNVLLGAWRLQRSVNLPTEHAGTAYVAVVDPGVGSERKNIIVRTKDKKYLVGPNNGVLSLAFSTGVEAAVEIENLSLTLLHNAQSRTFHGKDVFAPAAAHLLRGVPLREFGKELTESELAKITISSESSERSRSGCIVDIDGFGSIRTNVPNHIPEYYLGKKVPFRIFGDGNAHSDSARMVRTFAEAKRDEVVFVLSSTGYLDLAVNLGSAANRYKIQPEGIRVDERLEAKSRIVLNL